MADTVHITHTSPPDISSHLPQSEENKTNEKLVKKTHFVDSIMRSDLVSKSTTESSVTTVVSTLTKSSEEDQKSVLEDGTSADFSKMSGADLVKDPSKTSIDAKDDYKIEEPFEDRGTPDLSKKSLDLTKDYSKSSIDSKDTSRDFATNELSKDSTVDLTKDTSKASAESVKETSKSIDEKTFSEDHSSLDFPKTLASEVSEGITISKDIIEEERSLSKVFLTSPSSSLETSVMTESKLLSDYDEKTFDKTKASEQTDIEKDFNEDIGPNLQKVKTDFEMAKIGKSDTTIEEKLSLKEEVDDSIVHTYFRDLQGDPASDIETEVVRTITDPKIREKEKDLSQTKNDRFLDTSTETSKIMENAVEIKVTEYISDMEKETTEKKDILMVCEKVSESVIHQNLEEEVPLEDQITEFKKEQDLDIVATESITQLVTDEKKDAKVSDTLIEDNAQEAEDEVHDMKELNRRCSNLLEDISQGALIRIDSSHVSHGKFIFEV